MMRTPLLILFIFTLSPAQSFFSLHGLGEFNLPADARNAAAGNPVALTVTNPGLFINLHQTSMKISLFTTGVVGRQNNMTRALGMVKPGAFYGAVPLPTRTRILFGVDSRFAQDFDVWSESIADTTSRFHISSRGGIYSLNLGLAQSFLNHLCLGVQYHQLIGGSREDWHFCTPEGSITTDTVEIDYSARTLRFGVATRFSILTLASSYDLPQTIRARRIKHIHGVIIDSLQTYRIKLPSFITFALSAEPTQRIQLNAGVELLPWSEAMINDTSSHYRNTWRGSLGLKYEPIPAHPVRLGYSFGDWYCFNTATGKPINESGIHFGTGIPIPRFGAVDIAGELLFRFSLTPSGTLRETAGRLTLTIAYEEIWAKRTRRWGY
ncbi:MAG: hypothetical protein ACUVUR_02945 [bacterium]